MYHVLVESSRSDGLPRRKDRDRMTGMVDGLRVIPQWCDAVKRLGRVPLILPSCAPLLQLIRRGCVLSPIAQARVRQIVPGCDRRS